MNKITNKSRVPGQWVIYNRRCDEDFEIPCGMMLEERECYITADLDMSEDRADYNVNAIMDLVPCDPKQSPPFAMHTMMSSLKRAWPRADLVCVWEPDFDSLHSEANGGPGWVPLWDTYNRRGDKILYNNSED